MSAELIDYQDGDTVLEGYLATPSWGGDTWPAVLIAHEWWGHNDYVRKRADQLADMGYIGFAIDMYGKGVRAKDANEANNLMTPFVLNRDLCRRRIGSALAVLLADKRVNHTKLAAIGYCFGGLAALELARSGAPLAAVTTFHANLTTTNLADAKKIRARILVCTGADDPMVPSSQIAAFEDEMRAGGVDYTILKHGGCVHSFTVPSAGSDKSIGLAYNPIADQRSFAAMQIFLSEAFS